MKKVIVNDTEYTISVSLEPKRINILAPVNAVIDFLFPDQPQIIANLDRGALLILDMDMQGIIDQAFD